MPLPLIPIITALAAGGTLVPHAAGGMIVTSATGYVAGTYLSTTAIGSLLALVLPHSEPVPYIFRVSRVALSVVRESLEQPSAQLGSQAR